MNVYKKTHTYLKLDETQYIYMYMIVVCYVSVTLLTYHLSHELEHMRYLQVCGGVYGGSSA